jgi:hypothetical protein
MDRPAGGDRDSDRSDWQTVTVTVTVPYRDSDSDSDSDGRHTGSLTVTVRTRLGGRGPGRARATVSLTARSPGSRDSDRHRHSGCPRVNHRASDARSTIQVGPAARGRSHCHGDGHRRSNSELQPAKSEVRLPRCGLSPTVGHSGWPLQAAARSRRRTVGSLRVGLAVGVTHWHWHWQAGRSP